MPQSNRMIRTPEIVINNTVMRCEMREKQKWYVSQLIDGQNNTRQAHRSAKQRKLTDNIFPLPFEPLLYCPGIRFDSIPIRKQDEHIEHWIIMEEKKFWSFWDTLKTTTFEFPCLLFEYIESTRNYSIISLYFHSHCVQNVC